MTQPWLGVERPPADLEKFYAVTLTAAGPRIVVKDWLQITVADALQNFRKWFADLEIASLHSNTTEKEDQSPLSMFRLACTTLQKKQDGRFKKSRNMG